MTQTKAEPLEPHVQKYQAWSETQSNNNDLPDWLRLHELATARCAPNGHAEFAMNQLGKMLGKNNKHGEFRPVSSQNVSHAIANAVRLKYLDPSSHARCLVLPSHGFSTRLKGYTAPCPTCDGRQSKPRRFRRASGGVTEFSVTEIDRDSREGTQRNPRSTRSELSNFDKSVVEITHPFPKKVSNFDNNAEEAV